MFRKRVPKGRAAKENNLRSISDWISSTMRKFLLEDLRDRSN